jgi:circadian clock protein KaiB
MNRRGSPSSPTEVRAPRVSLRGRRGTAASVRLSAAGLVRRPPGGNRDDFWELRLYVAGRTPRAETALANLARACESHLRGRYSIEIIDLLVHPRLASVDQIVALPTVVRRLPTPIKKLIGDLSSLDRVLVGLELRSPEVQR